MRKSQLESSDSTSWNKFIVALEKENQIIPIQWNHNRELIMLDERKKSEILLKEICYYDCDV